MMAFIGARVWHEDRHFVWSVSVGGEVKEGCAPSAAEAWNRVWAAGKALMKPPKDDQPQQDDRLVQERWRT